jgi:hypothetical protein
MLLPALVTAPPMLLLLAHLDRFYGRRALPVGRPALVTVQFSEGRRLETLRPNLATPSGIAVETPPVRV